MSDPFETLIFLKYNHVTADMLQELEEHFGSKDAAYDWAAANVYDWRRDEFAALRLMCHKMKKVLAGTDSL